MTQVRVTLGPSSAAVACDANVVECVGSESVHDRDVASTWRGRFVCVTPHTLQTRTSVNIHKPPTIINALSAKIHRESSRSTRAQLWHKH